MMLAIISSSMRDLISPLIMILKDPIPKASCNVPGEEKDLTGLLKEFPRLLEMALSGLRVELKNGGKCGLESEGTSSTPPYPTGYSCN